jgi:hypothetical protein
MGAVQHDGKYRCRTGKHDDRRRLTTLRCPPPRRAADLRRRSIRAPILHGGRELTLDVAENGNGYAAACEIGVSSG